MPFKCFGLTFIVVIIMTLNAGKLMLHEILLAGHYENGLLAFLTLCARPWHPLFLVAKLLGTILYVN